MPRRGGMSSFLSSFGSVGVRFFGRSAGTGWRGAVEVVRASRVVDAAGSPGFVGACDAVGFRGPGLGAAEGAVPVCGVVPVWGAVEVVGLLWGWGAQGEPDGVRVLQDPLEHLVNEPLIGSELSRRAVGPRPRQLARHSLAHSPRSCTSHGQLDGLAGPTTSVNP